MRTLRTAILTLTMDYNLTEQEIRDLLKRFTRHCADQNLLTLGLDPACLVDGFECAVEFQDPEEA